MDNDKRIPLKFLEEAEDCCDLIESVVLGLANPIPHSQELDRALRAAHSVKGSAAMMGFIPLSHVAHQLEDFFKILRVRYHSKSISTEVETLLLQGVDCLRQVSDLHRQGRLVDEAWLATQSQPIFDRLCQQLGDLRPEDEDALLSQEGDVNPAILLFESGVKETLDLLDGDLARLSTVQLLQELQATADVFSDFGRMAKLERFVALCQSIKSAIQIVAPDLALQLIHESIEIWRKSHALVLLGQFDRLPDRLTDTLYSTALATPTLDRLEPDPFDPSYAGMAELAELESIDLSLLQSEMADLSVDLTKSSEALPLQGRRYPNEFGYFSLPQGRVSLTGAFKSSSDKIHNAIELLAELTALEVSALLCVLIPDDLPDLRQDRSPSDLAVIEFPELLSIFPHWNAPERELISELTVGEILEILSVLIPDREQNPQPDLHNFRQDRSSAELCSDLAPLEPELSPTQLDGDAPGDLPLESTPAPDLRSELAPLEPELPPSQIDGDAPAQNKLPPATTATVIATTIEKISTVTAPNPAIDSTSQTVRIPVEYLQQFNTVFGQLILERNAIGLRLEEIQHHARLLRQRMKYLESSNQELRQWYDRSATTGRLVSQPADAPPTTTSSTNSPLPMAETSASPGFDLLEMDSYNDLHLVSQHQIETIVQLQEVTTDIELSLQEMARSISSLNRTTRTLQQNLNRTQTIPFADAVKRFPRQIRDLSIQFNKPVILKIVGENTAIDRSILEHLSDPLIHLLRNAFDHGIEDSETRLAAGKSAQGTIVLAATQQSGEIVITISDDGGGIRLDRIRDRLQQSGLSAAEVSKISETELINTIFTAGFSTAASLTELSGRGVGLDVVRTNIEQIRGNIRIKTQLGIGTSLIIRVPITLSIVRVMLLERAGFVFAVSIDSIKETIRLQPDLPTADGTKIAWQSQEIPLIAIEQGISFGRMRQPFKLPGTPTVAQPTVLIVGDDRATTAWKIDRLWGEQEVTLRSIDSPMPLTPGFGNSIILGDGRVVPLVDLIQLADWMSSHTLESNATQARIDQTADRSQLARSVTTHSPEPTQTERILVIDDSITVRRCLAMMLEKEGYQVEEARDGREAVDKLLDGLVVQAAICDIEMPRLDGYGVLAALRANADFKDLPILMLTSRNSEKHRVLAMSLGASAYFSKPYNELELLNKLRLCCQKDPKF